MEAPNIRHTLITLPDDFNLDKAYLLDYWDRMSEYDKEVFVNLYQEESDSIFSPRVEKDGSRYLLFVLWFLKKGIRPPVSMSFDDNLVCYLEWDTVENHDMHMEIKQDGSVLIRMCTRHQEENVSITSATSHYFHYQQGEHSLRVIKSSPHRLWHVSFTY